MATDKDAVLARLADEQNAAQFVSFSAGADPVVRHARVSGHPVDEPFPDVRTAAAALLASARERLVNIRSFRPDRPKGNPFEYGLSDADVVARRVHALAAEGYTTIVNERVDVADGGVSGVVLGGIVEFAPLDTPRGVDEPGAASLPFDLTVRLLEAVYGFRPALRNVDGRRLEFSIHPSRVGYRRTHTLLWEEERVSPVTLEPTLVWPNRFSRFVGDKAYGLLMAYLLGLPVPATTVVARTVAPFRFGETTGTAEYWMRTSPPEPQPGRYPTTFGWTDPYTLLAKTDLDGAAVAAVLAQEGVDAGFSGASLPAADGDHVEGVAGPGDEFMLGRRRPEPLPAEVVEDVRELAARARRVLGPVRLEFAHDGKRAWVVQLHRSGHRYERGVISPGEPDAGWLDFDPVDGLEPLSALIDQARSQRRGVRVVGPVGITSHVGDLLRRAGLPARLHVGG